MIKFSEKSYNSLYCFGEKNIISQNKKNTGDFFYQFNLDFENLRIVKIISKKNTTILLTENNSIYLKGSSFLNFEDEKFNLISSKFNKDIETIDLGNEHIIILTSIINLIFLLKLFFN